MKSKKSLSVEAELATELMDGDLDPLPDRRSLSLPEFFRDFFPPAALGVPPPPDLPRWVQFELVSAYQIISQFPKFRLTVHVQRPIRADSADLTELFSSLPPS